MAKFLENADTNPLNSQFGNNHSFKSLGTNTANPMLPRRPDSLPMRPTSQQRPFNNSHSKFSPQARTEVPTVVQMGIHAKQLSPSMATAGSSKGEDHEPNLENLRRINRPPAVVSTTPPVVRSYPAKRRGDTHQVAGHSGPRQKMEGRGRGRDAIRPSVGTREDGRFRFSRMQDRYSNLDAWTQTRANGPNQAVDSSRNREESNSDMEIDEIDAFSENNSSSTSASTSRAHVEGHSKTAKPEKFGTPSFLQRNTVSRTAKYLSSVSNLSDDHQTPMHSFSNPQPRGGSYKSSFHFQNFFSHRPSSPSVTTPSPIILCHDVSPFENPQMIGAEVLKRPLDPSEQSDDWETPPKRKRPSIRADMGGKPLSKDSSSTERGNTRAPGEATSQLRTSRAGEAALTPPFPLSASKTSSPPSSEPKIEAMITSDPTVKQEPISSRPASPIDVDAPPLSLYEQLGLPNRTSGALRVPRPRFGKEEKGKKESWSKEVAESIRWVRGREGTIPPLIIGNIFWRPDGVSFDWKIPPEELIPRTVLEEPSSRAADNVTTHLDQESDSGLLEILKAQTSNTGVYGQATAEDIVITTLPPPLTTRQAKSPIRVKEEALEISLLPSEPSLTLSAQTDARLPRNLEHPTRTGHSSRKTGVPTPDLSKTPQSLRVSNTSTFTSPVTSPSLPTNPVFESPDALSNIATCFLDRYTRCFDHVKSRSKLSEAYTEDAIMSLQFNDLPTEGPCPRVGQPRKQSHAIVNYADRDFGRNLIVDSDRDPKDRQYRWRTKTSLVIGSQSIASRLATFEALSHTHSPSSSRAYQFTVTPIKELGLLILEYSGELYATKANSEERYVSLRFHRTFVMRSNEPDVASWIDWPWVVTNDQMTLFHRPGIVCQCPP